MSQSKIKINLSSPKVNYDIIIGQNLLDNFYTQIKDIKNINRYVIITENSVRKLYGLKLQKQLKAKKLKVDLLSFPAGEVNKNQYIKTKLENQMFAKACGRDTLIIALGGGVVGDLAGFIAATYMRGIPYVQVPTSLLAMTDSSVGGKTGIDNLYGKNLVGAFWQPQKVVADTSLLKSLPQEQFINGFIEALKMFLTNDASMVKYCIQNLDKILARDSKIVEKVITSAIRIKAQIVTQDEFEKNDRMILNFGHTIGHAIETLSNYKLLHGYAVALGILVEAKISELSKILDPKNYQLIEDTILKLDVNKKELQKYSQNKIIQIMKHDKKARQGKAQFVLLSDIGKVYKKNDSYAHNVSDKIVAKALGYFN